MKVKNIYKSIFALSLVIAVVSCKHDPSSNITMISSSLNPNEKLENTFEVHLNAKINLNDEFRIYYTTQKDPNFSENQVVRTKVFGFEEYQTIVYKLPKDDYPTNLRFDFGFNKNQKPLQLNNLTLLMHKKQITISGSELTDYFSLMEGSIEYDKKQKELKILINDTHLPIIFAKESLLKRMAQLF